MEKLVSDCSLTVNDSNQRSGIGICMESNCKSVESMLKYLQSSQPVCMISPRWPASMIDTALLRLGIKQVISSRTDLKTATLAPESFETRSVNSYTEPWFHDEAATILFTSGSTDHPKSVLHSVDHHMISAERAVTELNLGSHDRWLLSLPLWHVSGMSIVFRCLMAGAEIVIPDPGLSLYEAISTYCVTHISIVSTQLLQLMEMRPPSSITSVIVGGGPIPIYAAEKARRNGWPIRTTYGTTETSSMVTLSNLIFATGSVGHPLNGHELLIADDQEILVRSSSVCSGYLIDRKLYSIVDEDGWFHTGDLGMINERDELYVLGRKDNMFISGGENISSEEIEFHINNFSGIQEAVVVPVPDSKFGQRPVAFVRGLLQINDLSEYLNENLPRFMVPQIYDWPKSIPRNLSKPNRKLLTNEAMRLQDNITEQP